MNLELALGHCTAAGEGDNQDFIGMVTPVGRDLNEKGVLVAIADGVSGCADGRAAAEYAVRGVLTDYYATPATWDVPKALYAVVRAINNWLIAQAKSARYRSAGAMLATTLTILVLRGRNYHVSHVGDSRAYLYRGRSLRCLTEDHVWDHGGLQNVLRRAVGLDAGIALDFMAEPVEAGDIFLLVTDGVWAALQDRELSEILAAVSRGECLPEAAAETMVKNARSAGSLDDATAAIVRIDRVPEGDLRDSLATARRLPVPPKLRQGEQLDGMTVVDVLQETGATMVYRVRDVKTGAQYLLKTLAPERAEDAIELSALAHEEWIVRKLNAKFFPQWVSRPAEACSALYVLMTWHDGNTLRALAKADVNLSIPDSVRYAEQLCRAVGALHRRGIIHRDIKPENVHIDDSGQLRLIDFGLAESLADKAENVAPRAGTPSFLAPEQFQGATPSRQTDLYSTGVTVYNALTRHFPYGEIEPFQLPRFGEPVPLTRYRPDMPLWLETIILKAVARDPAERFETAEEMLLALERGAARPLATPRRRALAERDPLLFWKMVTLVSIVCNLLLLFLLVH